MRVLIVGAGYVGSRAAHLLAERGDEVWALRRSPLELPRPIRSIRADVATGEGLDALPRGLDALVYAVSPDERSDEAYRAAYPEGLRRVRQVCPDARVVFISSTAIYPQDNGVLVDESTPTSASSFSAQRLLEAEGSLLQGGPHAVVRASGIYGPGRHHLLKKLLATELSDEDRGRWTNRVFVSDLARALVFLVARPDLTGAFVASDPNPAELGDIQSWVLRQDWPEEFRMLAAEEKSHQGDAGARRRRPTRSRRIRGTRLTQEGFRFAFPSYREGYTQVLQELLVRRDESRLAESTAAAESTTKG